MVLLTFIGLVLLATVVCKIISESGIQENAVLMLREYAVWTSPGVVILTAALIWRANRQARARRAEKFGREQLSRDEMLKARSKLRNEMKPVRPAALRGPDTDLKY